MADTIIADLPLAQLEPDTGVYRYRLYATERALATGIGSAAGTPGPPPNTTELTWVGNAAPTNVQFGANADMSSIWVGDSAAWFAGLDGTAIVRLTVKADPTKYADFDLFTAPMDQGVYYQVGCTPAPGPAGFAPTPGTLCVLTKV